MKLAVFIERDGVLNRVRIERNFQVSPSELREFHPNTEAGSCLKRLKEAGFLIFVTTNQPRVSRGELSRRELDRMHDALRAALPIDEILVCPHDAVDDCPCRKPKTGLFIEASFNHLVSLENSFVVSDKWQDAEAAREIGSTSVLLNSPWIARVRPDYVLPDLKAVVEKILVLNTARLAPAI